MEQNNTLHEETLRLIAAGHEARKRQDWQTAIECYNRALDIEPTCPAREFRDMALAILGEWNRSMYDV